MSQTSDQAILSTRFDKNISNLSCEAYGCNNKATKQLTVNVGRHGSIDLNLCGSCIPAFDEEGKEAI